MKIAVILILIIAVSGCLQESKEHIQKYDVERVIDGDTLVLSNGVHVRLIGMNTPEKNEKCFEEGKEALSRLISNSSIDLKSDKRNKDNYHRLLRYVYIGEDFVNLDMVKNGYAYAENVTPNIIYSKEFADAEKYAKENKIGCLWN